MSIPVVIVIVLLIFLCVGGGHYGGGANGGLYAPNYGYGAGGLILLIVVAWVVFGGRL